MKLTDLHNHTTYSYDGSNTCEEIIENAISNGLSVVGISDHQFSLSNHLRDYIKKVNSLKLKYKNYIKVMCGLEIGTRPYPKDLIMSDIQKLDYCLFESLDSDNAMDLFEFLEWAKLFPIPKGLAHTDIFRLSDKYNIDILRFIRDNNFFWELNTSGNYNYYYDFITNINKQKLISKSKITVSIGSDTHWIHDFNKSKIISAHDLITNLGNTIIFY